MNKILTFGLTLAVTVSASGQFVRLEVDYIENNGKVPGDTYRVFAVMENEGDIIDAVYGEEKVPLKISATEPFYQHPRGGALSKDIQRYDYDSNVNPAADESLMYDSWFTIGAFDNYQNQINGFIMEPQLAEFELGKALVTNNGAWFVTPDQRQTMAPSNKRILLMQLTTQGEVNGLINLHGRTKSVLDSEGNVVVPHEEIRVEGLSFVCRRP